MDSSGRTLRIALTVLSVLLSVYLLGQLRGFLSDIWGVLQVLFIPFLIALVVTYLLEPLVELLVRRRVPRGMAIMVIYFAFVIFLAVAVLNAIPMVARQIDQLAQHTPQLVHQADHWLDQLNRRKQYLPEALRKAVEAGLAQAQLHIVQYASGLLGMVKGTVSALFIILTVPFLAFYMLKDARAIGRGMVRLSPDDTVIGCRDFGWHRPHAG